MENKVLTKKQMKGIVKKPRFNKNWDKLKVEFKTQFEKYNYIRNGYEEVIVSIELQEAIGKLLKIKYKVDNVRKLPKPYENLEKFVIQILNLI